MIQTMLNKINEMEVGDANCYQLGDRKIPRVTAIISNMIHSDSLLSWANSLGFKHQDYRTIRDTAAEIGTECHNAIDKSISETVVVDQFKFHEAETAYRGYVRWFNDICEKNTVELLMHEETLISPYFGGTVDGLYKINGKVYLVDYKTSNTITYRYCLQLAAYRWLLRNLKNIEIDGCIIVQLSKKEIGYNEYLYDFSNPAHLQFFNDCELAFVSLAFAYYNIDNVGRQFKTLEG